MIYSADFLEQVHTACPMETIAGNYVNLIRRGRTYVCKCPFHSDNSPSCTIYPDTESFYCFGCGTGGDVIKWIELIENLEFSDAVKLLAERSGLQLPTDKEAESRTRMRTRILAINRETANFYFRCLTANQDKRGLQYLISRKLKPETIRKYGLGYAPDSWNLLTDHLLKKGFTEEELLLADVAHRSAKSGRLYDAFRCRVMFPIVDTRGSVIGFGGRVMGDAKPKYLNSPETMIFDKSRNLYGLNRARRTKKPYFLLCEGYMDVISLHQAGFTNAVASLGTALTPGHAALIHRYVQEVYLTYDSDGAGTRAALRAMPILRDAGITAKIIRMEPYKDPDEFIKNLGAEAFEERIASARNVFMYSLEVLEKDYDMNSPEGKTEFMKETARRLTQFEEEIERNNYIEAVAKAYHVGFEELRKLVGKMAVQTGLAKPAERPREIQNNRKNKKEDGILVSQKVLLTWLIESEEIFHQIEKYITPEDFSEGLFRKVAELLYEQYEKHEANPAQIMNHFTDEEEHREVAGLFHTKIKELTTVKEQEKALQETILRVKEHSIEEATKNLDPTDIQGLQRLMNEKRKMQDLRTLHISIN